MQMLNVPNKVTELVKSTVRSHYPKRYFALLVCLIFLTALGPLVEHNFWARPIMGALVLLTMLQSALSAEGGGIARKITLGFAALAGILWMVAFWDYSHSFSDLSFQLAACAITLVFFAITSIIMLGDIYTGEITHNRICGAICIYMIIGFSFAMINMMIYLTDSTSYRDSSGADEKHLLAESLSPQQKLSIFIYVSFCTISTVGYGDITPVSRPARTFAWLEGVTGQIYLTVLVARLVGMHIAFTTTKKEEDSQ
jgi:hypothetical protein